MSAFPRGAIRSKGESGIDLPPPDVPILLAVMKANADYLVTHNRLHFMDDPDVALKANLRIGMPGECRLYNPYKDVHAATIHQAPYPLFTRLPGSPAALDRSFGGE